MQHSIGKTIRELRHARALTQEELAERLGVTAQAVSKWENESGFPDISQLVPLAQIFGVSTDVLLGTGKVGKCENVAEILTRAQKMIKFPLTAECLYNKYNVLIEGLKLYPNNFSLIIECMELEISLAYPKNPTYDEKNAKALYESCAEHANIIFALDDNVNRILRARMIMVMLHAAFGNMREARIEAEKFPARADFNLHKMYSIYAHWNKEYDNEIISYQFYIMNLLWAIIQGGVSLGKAYSFTKDGERALEVYERLIGILDVIFKSEIKMPFHHAEGGDLYVLIAEEAIKLGRSELAIESLEKAIHYDLKEKGELAASDFRIANPLLKDVGRRLGDRYQNLDEIMSKECFAPLRDNERFKKLQTDIDAFKERLK